MDKKAADEAIVTLANGDAVHAREIDDFLVGLLSPERHRRDRHQRRGAA